MSVSEEILIEVLAEIESYKENLINIGSASDDYKRGYYLAVNDLKYIVNKIAKREIGRKITVDIWSDGYRSTGQCGAAIYHGTVHGVSSLREACDEMATNNSTFAKYYDPNCMTYLGCKLFDNEIEARKHFG